MCTHAAPACVWWLPDVVHGYLLAREERVGHVVAGVQRVRNWTTKVPKRFEERGNTLNVFCRRGLVPELRIRCAASHRMLLFDCLQKLQPGLFLFAPGLGTRSVKLMICLGGSCDIRGERERSRAFAGV